MPTQPGGVSKSERLDALRAVLERWGRLDKAMIDQHVAAALGCDVEEIRRALYRDLEELVGRGDLVVHHFSRDGVKLDLTAEELPKNAVCQWESAKTSCLILGAGSLHKKGGQLLASDRIRSSIQVDSSPQKVDRGRIGLFFVLPGNATFFVSLSDESIPWTLVVARAGSGDDAASMAGCESRFGKRSALLLLPVPQLSGPKAGERAGHFAVEMRAAGIAQLSDLGSKNGTSAKSIVAHEASELCRADRFKPEFTRPQAFALSDAGVPLGSALKSGIPVGISIPSLIHVGRDVEFLLLSG